MKKIIKILGLFAVVGVFFFQSCDELNLEQPDLQSAEDEARAEYIVGEAFALANDNAGDDNTSGGKLVRDDACPTIELTGIFPNRVLTITFDNCEYNGTIHNGVINATFIRQEDTTRNYASMIITFDNYSVDDVALDGTVNVSVNGDESAPVITMTQSDMVATFSNTKTIEWNSAKTIEMSEGFLTSEIDDDVFLIDGTTNGVNREEEEFTSVQAGVRIESGCEYELPVSGTTTITSGESNISVVDYGDGECDNVINVTANGISKNITIE